jgi:hypothetical protein
MDLLENARLPPLKRDHPEFQKGPVGIKRGQYPHQLREQIDNREHFA